MSYTDVFGGQNIFPSDLSFLALAPTANVTLQWPTEVAIPGQNVFPDILELVPAAGLSITFPDARITGPGQSILVNNVGVNTISILDNTGANIGSVASGEVWQFYLNDNTTQAGVWRTFEFGAGASAAVAAALAGAGLKAILTTLNVRLLPRSSAVSPLAIVDADRATVVQWTGGVGAGTLPAPATLGTDWFVYIRNNGVGTWTITPAAGTIDGEADLELAPFNSAILYTDGVNYYTIGLTRTTPQNFDTVTVNVAGTGDYVLSGTELNRTSYSLVGILTGPRNIIVPNTVQQYWVSNETSGAFPLTVKTGLGAGVVVPQGYSLILYSDASDVISAMGAPATALLPTDIGGTGLPTYAQGDLIYATAAQVLARLSKDTNATRYLSNTGALNAPTWAQVDLTNGVTGQLPHANIANLSGTSVFGRSVNSAGVGGSIAGTNSQVLRVNDAGTSLGFGQVNLAAVAAVIGTLPTGNGGTGLIAYAQGDLIYSDAVNQLARLAKHTVFKRPLMNTGTNNNPVWGPLEAFVQSPPNATIAQGTTNWTLQYEASAGGGSVIEIPENASEAFPTGTIILYSNDEASGGNLEFTPLGAVILNVQGQAVTNPATFPLLPGYNAMLWKVATDTWHLFTDAPNTAEIGFVWSGAVTIGAGGIDASNLPVGWSVAKIATGRCEVTQTVGEQLHVTATAVADLDGDHNQYCVVGEDDTDSFQITRFDQDGGDANGSLYFYAKRPN